MGRSDEARDALAYVAQLEASVGGSAAQVN